MRGRKSRPSKAMKHQAEAIKEQVERRGEEFGRRAEAVVDALGDAVDRLQDLSTTAGRRASWRGRAATTRSAAAAREALDQARQAVRQVPDWDQVADIARRTGDKLMPERAKQRRMAERRRRIKMAAGGVGIAGLGAAVLAWLGADRRRAQRSEEAGDVPGTATPPRAAATGVGTTGPTVAPSTPTGPTTSVPSNPGSTTPTGHGNGHTKSGQAD